jgi:16S rRNA U1498 N3-methylase RsmE
MVEKTTELDCAGYIFLDTDYSEAIIDIRDDSKASSKSSAAVMSHGKLQAYVVEAAEQCERLTLPQFATIGSSAAAKSKVSEHHATTDSAAAGVAVTTKLTDFLRAWSSEQKDNNNGVKLLACRERSINSSSLSAWRALEQIYAAPPALHESASATGRVVAFLIGPEGGWSPKEEEMMDELEEDHPDAFFNVSLGSTVLRAETAAMTALAAFTLHRHDHLTKSQCL